MKSAIAIDVELRVKEASRMEPDISKMEEYRCPECGKPVLVSSLPDGRSRIEGCGPNCKRQTYDIPRGSIVVGPEDGPKSIYKPKAA